jgi:hypothetical protein
MGVTWSATYPGISSPFVLLLPRLNKGATGSHGRPPYARHRKAALAPGDPTRLYQPSLCVTRVTRSKALSTAHRGSGPRRPSVQMNKNPGANAVLRHPDRIQREPDERSALPYP